MSALAVYCWGSSGDGQLGYGGDDNVLTPKLLEALTEKRVRGIAAGAHHTVCVTEEGTVYTFGCNDHGELGHNKRRTRPEVVDALDAFRIVHVAAGSRFTLALTDDGQMLSWGAGDRGQLGLGLDALTTDKGAKPHKIKEMSKHRVVQISCGDAHCLALTETGAVFAWGDNTQGQLGLGTFVLEHTPKRVMGLWGHPVVKAVAGGTHSLAITRSGAVYAWGNNQFGQIGLGDEPKRARPTLVAGLKGKKVVDAAAGEAHTAVLTVEGRVFTFGAGASGQLGHELNQEEKFPKVVVDLMGSSSNLVACGRRHTVVYQAEKQRLYTFGLNASGQLGIDSTKSANSPKTVKALSAKKIVALSCAGDQTFAMVLPDDEPISAVDQPAMEATLAATPANAGIKRLFSEHANGSDKEGAVADGAMSDSESTSSTLPVPIPIPPLNDSSASASTNSPASEPVNIIDAEYQAVVNSLRPKSPAYLTLPHLRALLADRAHLGNAQHAIETAFGAVACMNGSFLADDHFEVSHTDSGVDMNQVRSAFSEIFAHPDSVLATTVGAATSKLVKALEQYAPSQPENARVYLLLLENPLMLSPSVYHTVLQRVATLMMGLKSDVRSILTSWWARLESSFFFRAVQVFQAFLSFLISQQGLHLNLDNSIAGCAAVIEMFYKINFEHNILPIRHFFNQDVSTKLNLLHDYQLWRSTPNAFSFCRYPFLLDTNAKVQILHFDAARQMQEQINETIFRQIALKEESSPLLLLKVARGPNLVRDVLSQIAQHPASDYRKPLLTQFEGEEGQDEGGVRKELFHIVMKTILDPDHGMFTYDEDTRTHWFNPFSTASATDYHRVGVLFGIAVYNGILVDAHFPALLYKKLLGLEPTLDDLADFRPSVAKSLQSVLEYDQLDLADVFALTFSVDQRHPDGRLITTELRKGGVDMAVTYYNRAEFVQRYLKFITVEQVLAQFEPFAQGFKTVINGDILRLFHPKEVEYLVRGSPMYHFHDLESVAQYGNGYSREHPVIQTFWKVFHSLPTDLKRKFLIFLSGTDRVPLGGLKSMRFIIQRVGDASRLPVAHTCFNILDLPEYASTDVLQEKLIYAILHGQQGFGLV